MRHVHAQVVTESDRLRISLDTTAKVKIGEFSPGGVARGLKSIGAREPIRKPELDQARVLELLALPESE